MVYANHKNIFTMKISRSTVDDHESQYDLTRDRRGGVGGCFGYSFSSEVGVTNADSKLIIKCISDQKLDSGESLGMRLSDLGSLYPLPPFSSPPEKAR